MEVEALWLATKEKYRGLFRSVLEMSVRDKRSLFFILRQQETVTTDTFIPAYGLHCGEFACFQILAEHARKETREASSPCAEHADAARLQALPVRSPA